jgi:hypothetical protein
MAKDSLSSASPRPFKVLVLGGSYGGLAAALNILDLSKGSGIARGGFESPTKDVIPVDVTVVDERDGFCKQPQHPVLTETSKYNGSQR